MANLALNINSLVKLCESFGSIKPDIVALLGLAQKRGVKALAARFDSPRVLEVRKSVKLPFHLEANVNDSLETAMSKLNPSLVCFVADKDTATAGGGLDLTKTRKRLEPKMKFLKRRGVKVILSLDPEARLIRQAREMGTNGVELCTLALSLASFRARRQEKVEDLHVAGLLVRELNLQLHAGRGINYENAASVADIPEMSFLNVGISVILRSLTVGLPEAVEEMAEIIQSANLSGVSF